MPHTKRAFNGLESKVLEIKEKINPSSLLYIGWRGDCHPWWHRVFCPALGITRIGILEINVENFQLACEKVKQGYFGEVEYEIMLGDARKAHELMQQKRYDIVFWDHGPEHVSLEDLKIATESIKIVTNKLVLYCCPWGRWSQDSMYGNEYEEHKSYIEPEHFIELGFDVVTFGQSGQEKEGELIAFLYR